YPTPQVDEFPSPLRVYQVLRSNGRVGRHWGHAAWSLASWWQEAPSNSCKDAREIETLRQQGVSKFAFHVHAHMFGRRIPAVVPIGPKAPVVELSCGIYFPERRESIRVNEGAF